MTPTDQIIAACSSAFFPGAHQQSCIFKLIKDGRASNAELYRLTGCSEARAKLFITTASSFVSGFKYFFGCVEDPGVFSEFPAQRLIRVVDVQEAVAWPIFWVQCGGRLFDGSMVALKWDPVWWKISAFNLPFPPFQLSSGYEVEDVDRGDAESLGIRVPNPLSASVKINIDPIDLAKRISSQLPS